MTASTRSRTGLVLVALAPLLTASAAGCADDTGCSLNGRCLAGGVCACDLPWSGRTCGRFELLDVNRTANPGAAVYGFAPNVSSWGGTIVAAEDSYHLFVAQMRTGGLVGWGSQSECVHAVSSSPTGPFQRRDLVLASECHGPVLIRGPAGEYLMFHIGSGPVGGSQTGFLHHSASPNGPWTAGPTGPGECGMPTAGYHPNGTLYAVCGNGAQLVAADSWSAPWRRLAVLPKPVGWEDPSIYWDRRGNWHIIFHVYSLSTNFTVQKYSGHGFSTDGWNWIFSEVEPFGGTVQFTDGTSKTFATRERPQLVFNDTARHTPVGFTSAVSPQPVGPWCRSECVQGACSQCKVTPGRDWTYTIYQGLRRD